VANAPCKEVRFTKTRKDRRLRFERAWATCLLVGARKTNHPVRRGNQAAGRVLASDN